MANSFVSGRFLDKALEGAKGLAGMDHSFSFSNTTTCTVRAFVSEDPEGMTAWISGNARLGGSLDNPVGVGLAVSGKQQRSGARAPVDVTLPPQEIKSMNMSSSTVFVMAAFNKNGRFKFIFENRPLAAADTMNFLDRHLSDPEEQWIQASTLRQAWEIRHAGSRPAYPRLGPIPEAQVPAGMIVSQPIFEKPHMPPDLVEASPRGLPRKQPSIDVTPLARPQTSTPGVAPAKAVSIWSVSSNQYLPAEVSGVALVALQDPFSGEMLPPGTLQCMYRLPSGEWKMKYVPPSRVSEMLAPAKQP